MKRAINRTSAIIMITLALVLIIASMIINSRGWNMVDSIRAHSSTNETYDGLCATLNIYTAITIYSFIAITIIELVLTIMGAGAITSTEGLFKWFMQEMKAALLIIVATSGSILCSDIWCMIKLNDVILLGLSAKAQVSASAFDLIAYLIYSMKVVGILFMTSALLYTVTYYEYTRLKETIKLKRSGITINTL